MLAKWRQGYQVVLARRTDRSTDNPLKAWSALAFYRLFNVMSRYDLPENVGDFRLMDKQVAAAIGHLNERGRMMKALMNWVGFSRTFVDYKRQKRSAGRSTFNLRSLLRLGLNGFFAFSTAPLRAILVMGLVAGGVAAIYSLSIVVRTMIQGVDVPGYASTVVIILVAAALQLTTLGIVGEYIARLFEEVKGRPNYLIGHRIRPEDARSVHAMSQTPQRHRMKRRRKVSHPMSAEATPFRRGKGFYLGAVIAAAAYLLTFLLIGVLACLPCRRQMTLLCKQRHSQRSLGGASTRICQLGGTL